MTNHFFRLLFLAIGTMMLFGCQQPPAEPSPSSAPSNTAAKPAMAAAASSATPQRADTVGVGRYANSSDGDESWRAEYIRHLRKQTRVCIDNHDPSTSNLNLDSEQVRAYCECSIESMIDQGDLAALRQAELNRDMEYLSQVTDAFADACHAKIIGN